ncbi:glycosyltransferase family 4 protein [Mycobacterium hubeiense]|uniref:glycosyltransferase family 4 protein n=1 Tax=Mycobacterium hubeiense TaxID=1867256 RepID=UPI000C7F4F0E|nr:glycosyltransferase family 4 protein [Mycobacterium sp. QGD 101]
MLWLSPWMRPLARVYAEALRSAGAELLLVTSDQHPSSDAARPYELVLDPRPKTARTWPSTARALRRVRGFAPDVVVAELVRDPRWLAFAPGVPRVELIHDDRPHDAGEMRPRWERGLFGRWAASAHRVAFSRYVSQAVGASSVVPLTSDLDDAEVPDFAPAGERRDFVLLGRLNGYKNIDTCLQAWQRHTAGPGWAGDDLVLVGDGDWRGALPKHVVWHRDSFRYADVLPVLARAKGSIVHYRRASQSGVQVLSMQLGVTPMVSSVGALPEFQPPGEPPIDVDDVNGLARAFDSLADPDRAAARGAAALDHYRRTYSAPVSARALLDVLSKTAAQPG